MFTSLFRFFLRNPLDLSLKRLVKENKSRILVIWNRGLGDIPLALYAFVHRVRSFLPHASITFLTRKELAEGFYMLGEGKVLVDPNWQRGDIISIKKSLKSHHLSPNMFDLIFERIDISHWLKWQKERLTPKLLWKEEWDNLAKSFALDTKENYIGVQVQTETHAYYNGRNRDWALPSWQQLFNQIRENNKGKIVLFGRKKNPAFLMENIIDLRGETSLLEMIALIKNHCSSLLVPDSGILSMVYYLKCSFPIRVVSLWGSPKHGVLWQNVSSPNTKLVHIPLIGLHQNITHIEVNNVYKALFAL